MSATDTMANTWKSVIGHLARLYHPRTWKEKGIRWSMGLIVGTYAIAVVVLGLLWSFEPRFFDVRRHNQEIAKEIKLPQEAEGQLPPGFTSAATAIGVARTLLDKPGGYLSNDVFPPGLYLDNIPNWEYGVLVQLRDFTRAMRNDFSRSQSQSTEDKALQIADPQFNYDSESWMLPSTESEYQKGIKALFNYLNRLSGVTPGNAQFFARSDSLRAYLAVVENRLGSLAQRLAAAVGHPQYQYTMDIPSERQGRIEQQGQVEQMAFKTSWWEIDDVFYEARGSAWALVHFLRALEVDFADILNRKTARVSLTQIIRELEHSQESVRSPFILNGRGFGILANHSLVMASYLARANAAVINLRDLLQQG